jgi:hypothetical protein
VLHLDVLKADRLLHLPPRFLLPRLGVSSCFGTGWHPPPLLPVFRCYSLRPLLFVVLGFRVTTLTRFVENTCNICISK